MYWTDFGTDRIQRANLDGSNVQTLVSRGLENPAGIAVDVAGGKMYWTDIGELGAGARFGKERIQRANLDGSNVQTLVTRTQGLVWPEDISLAVAGGKMYWTDRGADRIQRANLDGSNIETLVSRELENPSGIAVDVAAGKMYWTELGELGDGARFGKERIRRANLDGSNIETLVTRAQGLHSVGRIAVGVPSQATPPQIVQQPDLVVEPPTISGNVDQPSGATYQAGEVIATLPTGSWFPNVVSGASFRSGGGEITATFNNGGYITVGGTRYTCVASGGCQIEGRTVTQGTIEVGGTAPPPPVSQSTVESGATFTLSATVRNRGAGRAAATTLRYYRSTDSRISTSDTEVGTDSVRALSANRSSDESITLTVPTSAGTYYYGACVDSVANESDSTNNCSSAVSITVEGSSPEPTTLTLISGDNQTGLAGDPLVDPFVVEVRDQYGDPMADVSVSFAVTAGGGSLSAETATTDAAGRAASYLTLGSDAGSNTVEASVAGISSTVTFTAVAELLEFDLVLPAGISLIHVPLKARTVDGVAGTIESVGDLYHALGGEDNVIYLATRNSQTQEWIIYLNPSSNNRELTDDMGIITNLISPTPLHLSGRPLGTDGNSTIALNPGVNLVGVPLRDPRITDVSDLFTLEGIADNVLVIMAQDNNGEFKQINPTSAADIAITGGQSFIMTALRKDTVAISGDGWTNVSGTVASPAVRNADLRSTITGIHVRDTTPILVLRGSIVDEGRSVNAAGLRINVKNLSTDSEVTATVTDALGYRLAVVDIEAGRAAQIGDIIEISGQSPNPFIGVEPLRYTITTEDVKQSLIQLPNLVVYEIPAETELLSNYPNPFNPETWIPYRLASEADVLLSIYDINGVLVRELDIGYQQAGYYTDKSRTAYWDGRNEWGESVASGVYFYQLRAGDYSQMRKMVILK